MAASTIIKHLYDGALSVEDGTATPVTFSLPFTTGDFSVSGLAETQQNVNAYESRGTLNSVRHTSRTYPTGSFSLQVADLSDGTEQTALDFFLKQGAFSGNTSTLQGDVYCVKVTLTTAGTALGDTADHTVVLDDCHVTVDMAEGEPNTLTCNFVCYGSVSFI